MTIRTCFDDAVASAPQSVFQRFYDGKQWATRTFSELRERVLRTVAAIRPLGLVPGKDMAAIMLENQPDWQVLYLTLAGCGVTVVPLDPKLRATEVAHILGDSGAACVFVGAKQRDVIDEAATQLPNLRVVVWVGDAAQAIHGKATYVFSQMLDAASGALDAARAWYDAHRPTETTLASLIYTSGTTGRPKGAMLTHGNFMANLAGTRERVAFYPSDNFLNVLPLFHAFSFMGNFLLPLAVKGSTSFVRGLRTIADDMLVLRPTVLLAVPLLAEKLYARIDSQIRKSLVASGLFRFGFSRGLVARKVVERFGGKLRLLGIGGAPTSHETLEGFQKIGLFVLEGYGITECCPGVAYPDPRRFVIGTVGPVLDNMTYKIVDPDATGAGELLVKGPNVMQGYWHNPEQTAAAFDPDGYYRTGDIVRLDAEKNIQICGRTKALIVNREGKNIYPEEIEQALEHAPLIKDVIVLGYKVGADPGEHIGCILVPDADAIRAHLKGRVLTNEEMSAFIVDYAQGVCRASVADYKIPRKFVVKFEPLERTPSLKVRRVVYAGTLDEKAAPAPAVDANPVVEG